MKDVTMERTKELIEEPKLSKEQMAAMKLLLENHSMKEIARRLKIGRTKLWTITRDEFFKAELRSNQETIWNAALSNLVGESRAMSSVLIAIALDEDETSSVRLQAVKLAYRSVLDLGSQFEFRERLSALEKQLSEM